MTLAIRYILSGVLLVLVWQHAHWSVALMLTLLAVNTELEFLMWLRKKNREAANAVATKASSQGKNS